MMSPNKCIPKTIAPKPGNILESAKNYLENMKKKNEISSVNFVELVVSSYGIRNCSWKPQIVCVTRINSRNPFTFADYGTTTFIRCLMNPQQI